MIYQDPYYNVATADQLLVESELIFLSLDEFCKMRKDEDAHQF